MLNPINHARTRADVLSLQGRALRRLPPTSIRCQPHVGRGGWTWYTGSAGWLQRAGVESLLGLRLRGAFLRIDPCIPKAWGQFEADVKYRSARYKVLVENPGGVNRGVVSADVDGAELTERPLRVPLVDDGSIHRVKVRLG